MPDLIESAEGRDTSLDGCSQVLPGRGPVFTRLLLVLVGLVKFRVSAFDRLRDGLVMALISASLSWSVLRRLLLFFLVNRRPLPLPCRVGAPVRMISSSILSFDRYPFGRIQGSTPTVWAMSRRRRWSTWIESARPGEKLFFLGRGSAVVEEGSVRRFLSVLRRRTGELFSTWLRGCGTLSP